MSAIRPALTLLPGWGYAASVWSSVQTELAPHWDATAVDLPYDQAPEHWLDPKADWLDRAPAGWWVGWSLGGTVALALAAQAHPKVQGVILVAATPRWLPTSGWLHALDPVACADLAAELDAAGPMTTLRRFNALVSLGAAAPRAVQSLLQDHLLTRRSAIELGRGLAVMRAWDLREHAFRVPVRGLFGGGDRLLPQGLAESWLGRRCAASVTLLRAGHAPAWSQPQAFVQVLKDWGPGRG